MINTRKGNNVITIDLRNKNLDIIPSNIEANNDA